jgi:hypothetical protein
MSPVHVKCENGGPVGAFKSVRSARTMPLVRILTPSIQYGEPIRAFSMVEGGTSKI